MEKRSFVVLAVAACTAGATGAWAQAEGTAPAKLAPLPPTGTGNCDPGGCRPVKKPPPPPTLEHDPGGTASGTLNYPVYVNHQRCDGVYGKTDAEALALIRRIGGGTNWSKQFRVRRKGYASLWCVYRPGTPNQYGFVDGAATAGEASRLARNKALLIAGGKAGPLRWAEAWKF